MAMDELFRVVSGCLLVAVAGWQVGRWGSRVLAGSPGEARTRALWCAAGLTVLWAVVGWRALAGPLPLWWAPLPMLLGWFAVVLTAWDVLAHRLPNSLTLTAYPGVFGVLCLTALVNEESGVLGTALLGAACFAGVYAGVRAVVPAAMGAGDVKLAGSLGAAVGAVSPTAVAPVMVAAALGTLGAAVTLRRRAVAHGPAMLAPAWLVTVFPELVFSRFPGG